MPIKILIPTPLRPFTDKLDAVEVDGRDDRRAAAEPDDEVRRAEAAPVQRGGPAAQLRQRLRQRRGHPLPAEGTDAAQGGRHGEHHSVGRGRRVRSSRRGATAASAADAVRRRDPALQPPPDPAGSRHGRAAQAEGRQGAVHRRRRARIAGGDVSRRRRRRHASASSTSTSSTSATCSGRCCTATPDVGRSKLESAKDRLHRAQPERARRDLRDGAAARRTRWSCSSRTTSSSTAPTTSRRAIS